MRRPTLSRAGERKARPLAKNKGAKLTQATTDRAEALVDDLAPLGDVSLRKMFGGYGVFESGVMFALVDSNGVPHLRAVAETEPRYVAAGSTKHGMPYWSIPEPVLADEAALLEWAAEALDVARAAKKK